MFGWFKKKEAPPEVSELQAELFDLLKEGDTTTAEDASFMGIHFESCYVGVAAGRYYTNKEESTVSIGEDEFFCISHWSLKQKKDFVDFQSTCDESNDVKMLTSLGYFAYQGNVKAVKFVLSRHLDVSHTVDSPRAPSFRAPLYFALDNLPLAQALVEGGAKITDKVIETATLAVKGADDDDRLDVVSFMLKKSGKIGIVKEALKIHDKATAARILERLQKSAAPAEAPHVLLKADKTAPVIISHEDAATTVQYEKKVGDLTVIESYDFRDGERLTIMRRANGDVQGAPLREVFNALGRDHKGLQRAIADFRAAGGAYDDTSLPSAPRVRIVNPSSGQV